VNASGSGYRSHWTHADAAGNVLHAPDDSFSTHLREIRLLSYPVGSLDARSSNSRQTYDLVVLLLFLVLFSCLYSSSRFLFVVPS